MSKIDPLNKVARSARMAKIRASGNASTELLVELALRREQLRGWTKHPSNVLGRPDFIFPAERTLLFVDGCFWHACPRCQRRVPRTRRSFWSEKIEQNRRRDQRVRRALRKSGYHVLRVWEHEVGQGPWLARLRHTLARARENNMRGRAVAEPMARYKIDKRQRLVRSASSVLPLTVR